MLFWGISHGNSTPDWSTQPLRQDADWLQLPFNHKFLLNHLHLTPEHSVLANSLTYTCPRIPTATWISHLSSPRHKSAIIKSQPGISKLSSFFARAKEGSQEAPLCCHRWWKFPIFFLGIAFLLVSDLFPSFRTVLRALSTALISADFTTQPCIIFLLVQRIAIMSSSYLTKKEKMILSTILLCHRPSVFKWQGERKNFSVNKTIC